MDDRRADAVLRRRVLDHLSWTVHVLSGEVHRYGPAWGVRTPSLPQVWTLNQLHVTGPMPVPDMLALAGHHQQGLTFLHIEVADEPTAQALEERTRGHGWTVDCEVLMVLGRLAVADDPGGIVLLDEDEAMAVMRRWLEEEFPAMGDPVRKQLEEYTRGEGRLWGEQVLGRLDAGGRPVAMTKLRTSGSTAWVEDVYTVSEERRRGHARRLVARAASLASAVVDRGEGPGLAFIVADDNDWPKRLYAEIGFRPVGRMWTFHTEKGASTLRP